MSRISAASNLVVDAQPERWRLLIDGNGKLGGERVLVEAKPGEPIRYLEVFGSRRRLPESGVLALEDVERVALGWSTRDAAWHLGLVLSDRIAGERGSRWCEIVHWEDPHADQFRDAAVEAAHKLAAQIDRPFALVPPRIESAAPEPVVETPPPPLPELPARLEQWHVNTPTETSIELTLSPSWGRGRLLRAAWYIVWTGVFIILSTTSLTSGIALPRPEFLVYLGFVSAGILVIATIYTLYNVATRPNRVLIDSQSVRWLRDRSLQRRIAAADIQGVYATHITTRPGKRQNERTVTYGEINLYLKDGTFERLSTHSASGEHLPAGDDREAKEALTPLTPADAHTRLQIIALYAADRLGVPCWFDRRTH